MSFRAERCRSLAKLVLTSLFVATALSLAGAQPALAKVVRSPTKPSHFFYKITGPKSVSWLFGSIHVGDDANDKGEKIYPLPARVMEAFAGSELVAVELNPEAITAVSPKITRREVTASSILSPKEIAALGSISGAGPSAAKLDVCLASLAVQQSIIQSFSERLKNGVDLHFIQKSKSAGKKIIELETLAAQMDALVFNRLIPSQARDFCGAILKSSLAEQSPDLAAYEELQKLIRFWRNGDDAGVIELFQHEELKGVPVSTRNAAWRILGPDRNRVMAAELFKNVAAGKSVFAIVGAAHLVGNDSLPDLLRAKGLTVTRL